MRQVTGKVSALVPHLGEPDWQHRSARGQKGLAVQLPQSGDRTTLRRLFARLQMQGRRTFTLAFNGTLEGNKMSGTLQPDGGGGGRGGHGIGS